MSDGLITRAIILGGSHGWDESGFAGVRPFPLMPVAHSPLICHTLRWLSEAGIRHVTICTNEGWRLGKSALSDGALRHLHLSYYMDLIPRGAAGCVRDAAAQFGGDRFLVCDATILPDCDLATLFQEHESSAALMTVVVAPGEETNSAPLAARLRPVGAYLLEREALESVPEAGFQDLKEMLIPQLYRGNQPVATFQLPRSFGRITDVHSYLALCASAAIRLAKSEANWPGYRRVRESFVHETAQVADPSRLIGPVLVGAGSRVAATATVVGPTTIGTDCEVRRDAVLCSSVLWDQVEVGERAVVDHAIVTDGARLKPASRVEYLLFRGGSVDELAVGAI